MRIKDHSQGLWRLTIVLTLAAPIVGWLIMFFLDEAGIVRLNDEGIFILGSLFIVVPYIAVKSWLWIKRGYDLDQSSRSSN